MGGYAGCLTTMEQREFFRRTRIAPAKWRLTPWGDEGGGFWAVAIHRDRVLWYNDIEDGFNVSRFDEHGQIPRNEYWCNEDSLRWALPRLQGEPGTQLGPPGPVADAQDGPSQGLSTMLRRRRTGR